MSNVLAGIQKRHPEELHVFVLGYSCIWYKSWLHIRAVCTTAVGNTML